MVDSTMILIQLAVFLEIIEGRLICFYIYSLDIDLKFKHL